MTIQKAEDIKDTALKLDEIREHHPEDYFYLSPFSELCSQ